VWDNEVGHLVGTPPHRRASGRSRSAAGRVAGRVGLL